LKRIQSASQGFFKKNPLAAHKGPVMFKIFPMQKNRVNFSSIQLKIKDNSTDFFLIQE
jgi:hypothetical protein